jgi:thiol-disulfide isomerase/thioredoxin
VIVVVAIAAAVFWHEAQQARAAVGAPAPAFTLPSLTGGDVALADMHGDVVLLNFWTTWCDGCILEMPALVTFQQRYGHKLRQIGVNVQEPVATVEAFMAEFGVNYPTLLDQQGRTPSRYRLRAYPESWVLDRDGIARYHKPGPMTFEEMAAAYELASGESLSAEQPGPLPAGGQARALYMDGSALWLGGSGGLWRWADGQWSVAGPVEAAASGVYLIRSDGQGGIVVGTGDGLWHSPDGGQTWATPGGSAAWVPLWPGLPAGPVTGLTDGPDGPVAWVSGHGLFRHAGGRWEAVGATLPLAYPWVRLAAAPGGTLLAATPDGLQRSADGGQTWTATRHRQPVYDLLVDGDTVWLAGEEGIHRYSMAADAYEGIMPGREKWLSIYAGAPARRLTALASANGEVWAAAPTGDLYRSRPGQWDLVWPQFTEEE